MTDQIGDKFAVLVSLLEVLASVVVVTRVARRKKRPNSRKKRGRPRRRNAYANIVSCDLVRSVEKRKAECNMRAANGFWWTERNVATIATGDAAPSVERIG